MKPAWGRGLGLAGVAAYNWWVIVALGGHLLPGPNALFSDLESPGRADTHLLSALDVAAGVLIATGLILRGRRGATGRRPEWPWLLGFAVAGAIGGLFPYTCAEGLSTACRSAEWHLHLPTRHYVHVVSGIAEFGCVTVAVWLARRRSAGGRDPLARTAAAVAWGLLVAYPLLGASYLTDRLGALVEPIFFVCFSAMVLAELYEPAAALAGAGAEEPSGHP